MSENAYSQDIEVSRKYIVVPVYTRNFVSTLISISINVFLTDDYLGLANLVFIGPATTRIMKERKHQGIYSCMVMTFAADGLLLETRDGKKSYDPAPHSSEMQKLNKAFGRMHGCSSLLNLVAFLTTAYYGVVLAERIQ